jgi:hypothetical protein
VSIDSVVLSEGQQVELSRIAKSRSLPAGYVFRARLILMLAEGASFSTIKQKLGDDSAYHQSLEAALSCLRDRWFGYQSSRANGFRVDPEAAGPDPVGDTEETEGRLHALELPQVGCGSG